MCCDVGASHCNTELNCCPAALTVFVLQIPRIEIRRKHQAGEQAGLLPGVPEIKAPGDRTVV